MSGLYKICDSPSEGAYTIVATFEGSTITIHRFAETALGVVQHQHRFHLPLALPQSSRQHLN